VRVDPTIFKSYDVRGVYPSELSDEVAYAIGRCFVPLLRSRDTETNAPLRVVVGRDMRRTGEDLCVAFARGATQAGAGVVDIGMVSTDALYFAFGKLDLDGGVMITASHNPAQYNGMKFTGPQAQAISLDTGLATIRDQLLSRELPPKSATTGDISNRNVLDDFAQHCLSFVDRHKMKPLRIAVDAGNGMAGATVPHVFKDLPCELVPLYFELDGSFPNHPASPIEPENVVDLQRAVREHACDLGVAFICSRSVPELIEKAGGIPVRSRVGHSIIKAVMREEDIVFGGEHSGHFYFRDNWYADSGMIALLQCLEVFSEPGKPVSAVIAPIDTRFRSGEINSRVDNATPKLTAIEDRYPDAAIDHLDGVTISYPDWWMNVRASNTEPLLRLNVEGDTLTLMEQHRDEALALIRS
jgi:phosphomannomutase